MNNTQKVALDAEWRSGNVMSWVWQFPVRVEGLEIEEPLGGILESVLVGAKEQMAGSPVSLVSAVQSYREGAIKSSITGGWKVGPLLFPTVLVGVLFVVTIRGFQGRLRPFGSQVEK